MNKPQQLTSPQQLEAILQHIADGITVQNQTGELVYINPTAATILGYDCTTAAMEAGPATIIGKFEVFDEKEHPIPLTSLPGRRAMRGEAEPAMIIGFKHAGQTKVRWSSVKASPIYDEAGQVSHVVNVFQDITPLKDAELKLKDANKRITKLLEDVLKVDG